MRNGKYLKILPCISLIKLEHLFMFIKHSNFLSPKLSNYNIGSYLSWIHLSFYYFFFLFTDLYNLCTLVLDLCRYIQLQKSQTVVSILTL